MPPGEAGSILKSRGIIKVHSRRKPLRSKAIEGERGGAQDPKGLSEAWNQGSARASLCHRARPGSFAAFQCPDTRQGLWSRRSSRRRPAICVRPCLPVSREFHGPGTGGRRPAIVAASPKKKALDRSAPWAATHDRRSAREAFPFLSWRAPLPRARRTRPSTGPGSPVPTSAVPSWRCGPLPAAPASSNRSVRVQRGPLAPLSPLASSWAALSVLSPI